MNSTDWKPAAINYMNDSSQPTTLFANDLWITGEFTAQDLINSTWSLISPDWVVEQTKGLFDNIWAELGEV